MIIRIPDYMNMIDDAHIFSNYGEKLLMHDISYLKLESDHFLLLLCGLQRQVGRNLIKRRAETFWTKSAKYVLFWESELINLTYFVLN